MQGQEGFRFEANLELERHVWRSGQSLVCVEHLRERLVMGSYQSIVTAENIHLGWSGCCPDTEFGGVTFQQHQSGLQAYHEVEAEVAWHENQLAGARAHRDLERETLNTLNQRCVHGLLSHPEHGDDSALYAQWGYTRRSERSSGLTRPGTEPPTTGEAV